MNQLRDFPNIFVGRYPNYAYEAGLFFGFLKDTGKPYSVESVVDYRNSLSRRAKSGTYNKRLSAAKKVIKEYYSTFEPEKSPVVNYGLSDIDGKKLADKSVRDDRFHSPSDIKRMIDVAPCRTKLMIKFLTWTGVRVSEACDITLQDLSESLGWVNITINGKGNKERLVKVRSNLVEEIKDIFKSQKFLFETRDHLRYDRCDFSRCITRAGRRVGIKTSAHRLRHSFATEFLKQNPGKFKELSSYLGHASIAITMDIYAHSAMEEEYLTSTMAFLRES